jgi:hypothetical protein
MDPSSILGGRTFFSAKIKNVHKKYSKTAYSSVGRAGDCSCSTIDISRSLVRIRLGGTFGFDAFSSFHTNLFLDGAIGSAPGC